jgi:hypothetical protein
MAVLVPTPPPDVVILFPEFGADVKPVIDPVMAALAVQTPVNPESVNDPPDRILAEIIYGTSVPLGRFVVVKFTLTVPPLATVDVLAVNSNVA